MRSDDRTWSAVLALLLALGAAYAVPAAAQSKEQERRRKLMEQLGVQPSERGEIGDDGETGDGDDKQPPDAKNDAGDDEDDEGKPPRDDKQDGKRAPPDDKPEGTASDDKRQGEAGSAAPSWGSVHSLLMKRCHRCHKDGKKGARAGYLLTGDSRADADATRPYLDARSPLGSQLWSKSNDGHEKGKPPLKSEAERDVLKRWLLDGGRAPRGDARPAAPDAAPPTADRRAPTPGGTKPPSTSTLTPQDAVAQPPVASQPAVSPPPPSTTAAPVLGPAPVPASAAATSDDRVWFLPDVHVRLVALCAECHASGEMGADSGYITTTDKGAHYQSARRFAVPGAPQLSRLYTAGLGDDHEDVIFKAGSVDAELVRRWIDDGALAWPAPAAAATTTSAAGTGDATGEAALADALPPPPPSSATAASTPLVSPQPLLDSLAQISPLLGGISLHGRFDLSYERRGYRGNPLLKGDDVLRSYHHFVYFGRHTTHDPIGIDVELTSLQFWTLSADFRFGPAAFGAKAGKLIVPFGADPTVHASYGGLAGFDQKLLPPIWAQEGAAAHSRLSLLGATFSADAYVVRGYRLPDANAVLNLQTHFSPNDDVQLGMGGRVSASWGPFRAWYSAYVNPLDHDQLLFMQALDVGFFRWRTVPFLRDLALSAGVLRADVSGAGPGQDHYHFGSYLQARYYPIEGLYLQYRQGIRTWENRGGLFVDDKRLTSDDGSTHSVAAVYTWRGLYLGVFHFWNFEQVDELDDDFLRVTVGYAF